MTLAISPEVLSMLPAWMVAELIGERSGLLRAPGASAAAVILQGLPDSIALLRDADVGQLIAAVQPIGAGCRGTMLDCSIGESDGAGVHAHFSSSSRRRHRRQNTCARLKRLLSGQGAACADGTTPQESAAAAASHRVARSSGASNQNSPP